MRWDEMRWDEMWSDEMRWYEMRWDEMIWDDLRWDQIRCDMMIWDDLIWWYHMRSDEIRWYDMRWDEMIWDEMRWDEMSDLIWSDLRWDKMRWYDYGSILCWKRSSGVGFGTPHTTKPPTWAIYVDFLYFRHNNIQILNFNFKILASHFFLSVECLIVHGKQDGIIAISSEESPSHSQRTAG